MKELQIQILHETKLTKKEYIPAIISYALFFIACVKVLFSGFETLVPVWWIYALSGAVLGSVLLTFTNGRSREYVLPVGMAVLLISFFVGISYCKNGLCVLGNEYLKFLTEKNGQIYLDFPASGNQGVYYVTALICIMLVLILVEVFVRKNKLFIYAVTVLCMIGCLAGIFRLDYGIILLLGTTMFVLFSGNYKISKIQGVISYLFTYAGMIGLCALAAIIITMSFGEQFSTKHISRSIKHKIHQQKYDDEINAMPEGDLRNLTYFKKSSKPALVITTKNPQKFYLRGLVGEVYTGNAWEPQKKEIYTENEDLFYWLHKQEFYGQTSIASAMSVANIEEKQKLKIRNVSACQERQFLPYSLADTVLLDSEQIADGTVLAGDTSEIICSYISGSLPQWYQTFMYLSEHTEQAKVQNYLKLEQSYRDYVYTNDLQLTNSVLGVMERIFGTEKKEYSIAEIMALVRETLEHNLEYKENVTTSNGKNDFIKYTLEQSREGYSVHYATAATMMFRYFGVPARYVEGYYLSSEEAKNYAPMDEITLTEGNAHAWTEIYLDGIGWIPFEVTPGYIDEEELAQAEQVISDGMGEGAGKSYAGSKLTYKPPKQQEDDEKAPNRKDLFRFTVKDVLSILLILLILFILFGVYQILSRRKKLLDFLKEMKSADHRDTITGLFGYSMMLMERCKISHEEFKEVEEINTEARFSNHAMSMEQRQKVEKFAEQIVEKCKQNLSLWKKIRYHYVLWLYR